MAKIEQASTVTEAKVATALIESNIVLISLEQRMTMGGRNQRHHGRRHSPQENRATVTELAHCVLAVAMGWEIWWDV
jgi:hypothetical protein